MHYDIIIIGAGLGGLTAGAKLAKEGRKVLLVEQHKKPGGCATIFKRKEFIFEVGLHEMDGIKDTDMKVKIFRELGVFDQVEFLRVPEFYRFANNRYQITIPHDIDQTKTLLAEHFPEEKAGIDAYFDQIVNAKRKAKDNEGKSEISLGTFMDSILQNEDLKLILLGNLGYFHDDPYSVSLTYYSLAQARYYQGGGSFIKGGSQTLSNFLSTYISEHNGSVVLGHMVTEILTEDNCAVGIRYKDVKDETAELQTAYGKEIILNGALPEAAERLLPGTTGKLLGDSIRTLEIGASLLTVYFAFDIDLKLLGNNFYSTFVFDSSIKTQGDIGPNNASDFKTRSYTFVDYGRVDSKLAPEGKSVGVICCMDYLKDWENLNEEDYKAKKEQVAQIFTDKLDQLIPGVKSHIVHCEVGTAKTVKRYTLNTSGAVYGFAQTPERLMNEKIARIDHLHYASAWTKTGGGFSGAIFSGYLCAMDILRKKG
jgi:phytoene dehydrogenase-like protein